MEPFIIKLIVVILKLIAFGIVYMAVVFGLIWLGMVIEEKFNIKL